MKGKNENHNLNDPHRDIEKFEDTLFRALATMDRDLLQALIDDFGLETCDRDGRNILHELSHRAWRRTIPIIIERA